MLELNMSIVYNLVNIIILYLLLKFFLFKPVIGIIEKREAEIKKTYDNANMAKIEAGELKAQYETSILTAKNEAETILTKAKKRSQEEYDVVLQNANEYAARLLNDAEKTIDLEREKAIFEVQSQIADIAILAAMKASDKGIDESKGRKLIDDFLAEAGAAQ